jgi:hypothetical protein
MSKLGGGAQPTPPAGRPHAMRHVLSHLSGAALLPRAGTDAATDMTAPSQRC